MKYTIPLAPQSAIISTYHLGLTGTAPKGLVINYREGGGGYKMGKSRVRNMLRPPPSRQVKTFCPPPLLKSGNFLPPPFNMAKTSSYHVKPTPKLFVSPPSAWLRLFPPPPPFRRGKTSHAPPLPFCSRLLPVISDQSLI